MTCGFSWVTVTCVRERQQCLRALGEIAPGAGGRLSMSATALVGHPVLCSCLPVLAVVVAAAAAMRLLAWPSSCCLLPKCHCAQLVAACLLGMVLPSCHAARQPACVGRQQRCVASAGKMQPRSAGANWPLTVCRRCNAVSTHNPRRRRARAEMAAAKRGCRKLRVLLLLLLDLPRLPLLAMAAPVFLLERLFIANALRSIEQAGHRQNPTSIFELYIRRANLTN